MTAKEFIEFVAKRAPALYSEPLQGETRRRQMALFISSLVTLFLWGGWITITKIEQGGVELAISAKGHFEWVAWAITLYCLSSFCLACYQDVKISGITVVPQKSDFLDVIASTHNELIECINRSNTLAKESVDLVGARLKKLDLRREKFENELRDKEAKASSDPLGYWKDELSGVGATLETGKLGYEDELEAKEAEIKSLSSRVEFLGRRVISVREVALTMTRLQKGRLALDVGFPIALALYALVQPFAAAPK